MATTFFFSGWAIPPTYVNLPLDVISIDTTLLAPSLFIEDEEHSPSLRKTWIQQILTQWDIQEGDTLIGYSLGALVALSIATHCSVSLHLFAPCFSFVKQKNISYGVSKKVIRAMQRGVTIDTPKVLNAFYHQAQLSLNDESVSYDKLSLQRGLELLLRINLTQSSFKVKDIVLYASQADSIISYTASQEVANYFKVPLIELPNGHNLLTPSVIKEFL